MSPLASRHIGAAAHDKLRGGTARESWRAAPGKKAELDYQPVRFASGLNLSFAMWQVFSPFILGYAGVPLALWNGLMVGLAMLALASFRTLRPGRSSLPGWLNLLLGTWLAVSPFVLGFASVNAAAANHITIGIAVMFFALA